MSDEWESVAGDQWTPRRESDRHTPGASNWRAEVAAWRQKQEVDLYAIDRLLALSHRDDDQACSCDECMSYGAEDIGADWMRIPPANRIVMRILDGGDDRFAILVTALRDHDADALSKDTG